MSAAQPEIDALLVLCAGASSPWGEHLSDAESWDRLLALLDQHGMLAAAHAAAALCQSAMPDAVRARLRSAYINQTAQAVWAREQIAELAAAMHGLGAEVVALKGIASCLATYPDPGTRALGDIDLLVRDDDVPTCTQALEELGYAPSGAYSSTIERDIAARHIHLLPYHRAGSLPVEAHTSILYGHGNRDRCSCDLWGAAAPAGDGEPGLLVPSAEHALLHAAVHFSLDIRRGAGSLKDIADILALLTHRRPEIDDARLMATADLWGVREDLEMIAATVADLWGVVLPGADTGRPLSAERVAHTWQDAAGRARDMEARPVADRLRMAGDLGSPTRRLRYYAGLVFPTREYIRWRYHVRPGASLASAYVRHVSWAVRQGASALVGRRARS